MAIVIYPNTPAPLEPPSEGKAFLIQYKVDNVVKMVFIFLSKDNLPYPDSKNPGRILYPYEFDSEGKAGVISYLDGVYTLLKRVDTIGEVLSYLVNEGLLSSITKTIIN